MESPAAIEPVRAITSAEAAHTLLASFLGWALDAFDFFILIFVMPAVAREFHRPISHIAFTITATLALRPVGALIFGWIADRYGRRIPLMIDVVFYSIVEVLSGLAPSYGWFLAMRALYGIGMGGEWGVGASLAMEAVAPRWRGFFSGLLQEGYAVGYLLAAAAFFFVFPRFGWRAMFFLGGAPALLTIYIRTKVPDSFLARADQIVNIDVPVEALRERLREGKIYPREQIENALKNFFKPSNLASLRELALREVARSLDRQRLDRESIKREGGHRSNVIDRIMVGVSSNASDTGQLLRKASRIAGQLNAEWFAVHIETPSESVKNIGTRDFVALLDNINVASDLGAETVWLKSDDVVKALIDFAHDKGVSKVIVSRTHQPRWRRWLKGDVVARLVADATDLDVEIVATEEREDSR